MNKPINPALARIQQIKSKAGSGGGSSFDDIEPFMNPILEQAAKEVAAERTTPVEVLPPIEEDPDELRVAMRLVALQAEGVGPVAPTKTIVYTDTRGAIDRLNESLEKMKPKRE
jgi:hypothetical protein